MRSINFLKVAVEAELLRLRAMAGRQGRRAAFGAIAFIFGLGVLVLAEVAGWQALRLYALPIATTLILLAVNLIVAIFWLVCRTIVSGACRARGLARAATGS
jgi:hypothetical protein